MGIEGCIEICSTILLLDVEECIADVLHACYNFIMEEFHMNKTISMSIRVSEDEMIKIKKATRLESYASYSEFVRRTALIEAEKAINSKRNKEEK